MKRYLNRFFLLASTGLIPAIATAQETAEASGLEISESDYMYMIIIVAGLIVLVAAFMMNNAIRVMTNEIHKSIMKERGIDVDAVEEKAKSDWVDLERSLTDAVPVEEEEEILFEHEYDGIRELDNNLPPWWTGGFIFTIIFGLIYFLNYHGIGNGKLMYEEYQEELEIAEIQRDQYLKKIANLVNESNVEVLHNPGDIAAGRNLFQQHCVICHGAEGQGKVGPNLTDKYWIHGGSIGDIFETIKYGVPAKGMIPWQAQLKPNEIQLVASYIWSLEGTNPPSPKEKEGDYYDRSGATEDGSAGEGNDGNEANEMTADSTSAVEAEPSRGM